MGSLSNLFISQSYISLIHLGSNNTASSTPIELEDGLGNGLGVSVSTNKNLYVSGNIYATNLTGSGGSVDTSSLVTTASFNAYTQSTNTFTASISTSVGLLQTFSGSQYKADSASFSSRILAITGSSIDTGSLVTTASFNAYTASQDFKNTTFATTSSLTNLSASLYFTDTTQSVNIGTNSSSIGLLQTFSGSQYKNDSASFDTRINSAGGNVSVQDEGTILGNATSFNFIGAGVSASVSAGTASVTITGGGSINTSSFATTGSNTFTGQQTLSDVDRLNEITLDDHSGSLVLFAKGFTSSSLTHISASSAGVGNIIFKTNNNTATTIVSGSSNILTNAAAATAGFNRYIGGSGNVILNGSNVPQISSSMTISPTMNNNYFGGNSTTLIMRGPASSSAWTISANSILGTVSIGSSDSNHARGIQSGLTMTGNEIPGTLTLIANKANLSSSLNFTNNILNGALSLNVNSSSVVMTNNNINDGGFTLNNNFFSSSAGVGSVTISGNNIGGAANTITIQGTQPTGTNNAVFVNANTILGGANTLFVDPTNTTVIGTNAYHSSNRTIIGGNQLIVSASSLGTDFNSLGSVFFGRYNANDGIRNKTSNIVFAVGTGNSTTRKTGLLIDSGSNTFIEGTLNLSGSLTVTSSVLNIDGSGNITASKILVTDSGTTAIQYNQQSTGSVAGVFNTSYGKDNLKVYQYQGQPYAFNVNLTANQANAYSGSEFQWGLQVNGSNVSIPGGGGTYFSMVSGSNTGSASDPAANKRGLDYLGTSMVLDMRADTTFNRSVYIDQGMFVSQSVGGSSKAALTVDGTNANASRALVVTGSVDINGTTTIQSGSSFFANGNKQFNVGAFSSLVTQSGSAGVSQSVNFEVTDISEGISIASNSRITLANRGTYSITFSAQIKADGGQDTLWMWLKKNGSNVANTSTKIVGKNGEETVLTVNYVVDASSNDYYELVWQNLNGYADLLYEGTSGNYPAIPSIILTVTQVR